MDSDDFDNGCGRCFGQGMITMGHLVVRCPRCIANGRPANPALLAPVMGGQGDSDAAAAHNAEGVFFWLLCVLAAAVLLVLYVALRGGR